MKLSLRTSSIFAAVAVSVYSLFALVRTIPNVAEWLFYWDKEFVLSYSCTFLLMIGMVMLGLSLFRNRKQVPVLPKPLIWQARIIVGILVFALILNISAHIIVIDVPPYFVWYRLEWLRYIMLLLITAWLWQLVYINPTKYFYAKHIDKMGLAVSIIISFILLLWLISLVHVFITGQVFGFCTNLLTSWIIPLLTLLLLTIYLFELRQLNKVTKDSPMC